MRLAAGAAALLAVGAGLGTYFAVGGTSYARVPAGDQDPILEKAMREGIIPGYRVAQGGWGSVRYVVSGSDIEVTHAGCVGQMSCPSATQSIYEVTHGPGSADTAQGLVRIARAWGGHGLKVKVFETTTLDSHIPDARIMLIPKAGA